jgi:CopG family nickel-responsive transcriptional regulator
MQPEEGFENHRRHAVRRSAAAMRASRTGEARKGRTQHGVQDMKPLRRFGVSIDGDLIERFDRLIQSQGYVNRSEAIRDLIRDRLVQKEEIPEKTVIGILSVVYDHHVPNLVNRLTELQHGFLDGIISTLHIHLDHQHCLEVLVIRDRAGRIQQLCDSIASQRRVEHVRLTFTTAGF